MSCRELKYYLYNNGNMTHDGRKGIDITYDVNNMPQTVSRNDTLKAAYTYLSDGTKVMVQDKADNTSSNGYLYLGSMVFRKTGTSYAFESTDFGGGRIINVNGTLTPYYYTTDHLGSVRAITDAGGNVVERNDYYPFGESMTTGNTYPTMAVNRWKYNGKETQTTGEVNWLDYGARMYDDVIGRWTKPDPMSEKYYGTSGYAYCVNNPIKYIDKHGSIIVDSCGHIAYDAKKGWTKYATTNVKRIGNAMFKTSTGKMQWDKMVKSSVRITLEISNKSKKADPSGYRLGISNSIFSGDKLNKTTIVIYEGSIKDLMNDNGVANKGVTAMYKNNTITIDEKIAAVAGHEAEHNVNEENIKLRLRNNAPGVEDSPTRIEERILEETLRNHEKQEEQEY